MVAIKEDAYETYRAISDCPRCEGTKALDLAYNPPRPYYPQGFCLTFDRTITCPHCNGVDIYVSSARAGLAVPIG